MKKSNLGSMCVPLNSGLKPKQETTAKSSKSVLVGNLENNSALSVKLRQILTHNFNFFFSVDVLLKNFVFLSPMFNIFASS